jgi:hypothetical protein
LIKWFKESDLLRNYEIRSKWLGFDLANLIQSSMYNFTFEFAKIISKDPSSSTSIITSILSQYLGLANIENVNIRNLSIDNY